jgi:hypothetical protein
MRGALVDSLLTQLFFSEVLLMKFARFMTLAALVAVSAVGVNAGSIKPNSKEAPGDPKLTVNGKPIGGVTNQGARPFVIQTFGSSVTHIGTPLMIPFSIITSGTDDLEYVGPPNAIHNMWVEIVGIPLSDTQSFSCTSDIFKSFNDPAGNCGGPSFQVGGKVLFDLFGGTLNSGDQILVNLTPSPTPEPSMLLMFLSLGPAIGFAKKRWNARQSA